MATTPPEKQQLTRIQKIVIWIDRRRFRLGCGGALFIIVAMSIAMMIGAMNALKEFPLYRVAAQAIVDDPLIQQELGEPISHRISMMDRAKIEVNGQSGKAQFHLILSGAKRSADAIVLAKLIGEDWKYQAITVRVEGRAQPIEVNVDNLETVSLQEIEDINKPDPEKAGRKQPAESE